MTPLSEAKHFVALHARHMGFKGPFVARTLGRIKTLDGEGAGAWVDEWAREAGALAQQGKLTAAANLYNLARFPVADSPRKQEAANEAARVFAQHLRASQAGERRVAHVHGTAVPFLFRPGPHAGAPLVVLMGGIVSLKEQWGGFLGLGARLGCAVAIADFPGVGENRLTYTRGASRLFGAIMDACSDAADATRTQVVAPSFGGHLAMLEVLQDPRICGIVTVGAPISCFFRDAKTRRQIPFITRRALEHTTASSDGCLNECLESLALSKEEIARLHVPILYVASLRDEIIPVDEWRTAEALNSNVHVVAFDDVHGSPSHLASTRLLILSVLCRHAGKARLSGWLRRGADFAALLTSTFQRHSFA